MAGKYKRIYIGGSILTLIALFTVLTLIGLQITSDGDKECPGTIKEPCISYITVNNPTAKSIYIYNKQNITLEFTPEISSYQLYVKYYGKWVPMNFTYDTRLGNVPKDAIYNFVFPRYSIKEFKLVGYKKSPLNRVKWSFGTEGEILDPVWESAPLVEQGAYFDKITRPDRTVSLVTSPYPINTYEDNDWKKLKDARSLKSSDIRLGQIEVDQLIKIEFTDYNYTDVCIKSEFDDSLLKTKIPVKIDGITKFEFNYNSATKNAINNKTFCFSNKILGKSFMEMSNFTIGTNPSSFSINNSNTAPHIQGSGVSYGSSRNETNYVAASSAAMGQRVTNFDLWRTGLNSSLGPMANTTGITVTGANISIWITGITMNKNYTVVGKQANFTLPIGTTGNDNIAFEGWSASTTGLLPYGGRNFTEIQNTSAVQVNKYFNISISSVGRTAMASMGGSDFMLMILHTDDVLGIAPTDSQFMAVGDNFAFAPILYVEYTQNTAPTFNAGYPKLNSTDGTNVSTKNLLTSFVATDNDPEDRTLRYNVTWYKNNITNLNLSNIYYINGTMGNQILQSANLTGGDAWKSQINLFDNTTNVWANTSELLIIALPPNNPNFTVIINSSNVNTNNTNVNLTVITTNTDSTGLSNITNWYENNQSLLVLNMPFTTNTSDVKDYSGYNNNGTISGALWQRYLNEDNNSLVLLMPFDEDNSSTAIDKSDYGNNGVLIGGVALNSSDCITGTCYTFDGTNDYIQINDSNSIDIGNRSFTLETWFKSSTAGAGTNRFFIVKYGTGNARGYVFKQNLNNQLCFSMTNETVNREACNLNNDYNDYVWHHMAGVKNETTLMLYVDGNIINQSTTFSEGFNVSNDIPLFAGARYGTGTPSLFYNGNIDNVRIYKKALTSNEITDHYEKYKLYYSPSFKFDGVNDFITNSTALNNLIIPPSVTLETWINLQDANNGFRTIFNLVTTGTAPYHFWNLRVNQNTRLLSVVWSNGVGGTQQSSTSNSAIPNNTWTHIAVVRSPPENYKYYINGILDKNINENRLYENVTFKGNYYLGAYLDGSLPLIRFFNGSISSVRIYNRSLSANQIYELYNSYNTSALNKLVSEETTAGRTYKAQVYVANKTSVGEGKNTSELLILGEFTLNLNGTQSNKEVELGTAINITANITGGARICIDINHHSYGNNYSCGTNRVEVTFNITFFRKNLLNDSSQNFNLTYTGNQNKSIYINAHQYDEIINVSINLTGFASNGLFPKGVRIYLNNSKNYTLSNNLGDLVNSGIVQLNTLSDGTTGKNVSFTSGSGGSTIVGYLRIPKAASIANANITFSGYKGPSSFSLSAPTTNLYTAWGNAAGPACGTTGYQIETSLARILLDSSGGSNYCKRAVIQWDVLNTTMSDAANVTDVNITYTIPSVPDVTFDGNCDWNVMETKPSSHLVLNMYGDAANGTKIISADINCKSAGSGYQLSIGTNASISIKNTSHLDYFALGIVPTDQTKTIQAQQTEFSSATLSVSYETNITNPWMEIGDVDGRRDWNFTNSFHASGNYTTNLSSAIANYTSTCTADADGFCLVPVTIYSETPGRLQIDRLFVEYTLGATPIQTRVLLNAELIRSFLTNRSSIENITTNFTNIPIRIESSQEGIIQISDVRFDYAGGNKNYTITAYQENIPGWNKTFQVNFTYSRYDWQFPANIKFLEFIPRNNMSNNVTPFGQTNNKAIFNITTYNYGRPMNFSILINETAPNSCVNLSVNVISNVTNATRLFANNWTDLKTNMSYLNKVDVWMWASYNCNFTAWRLWNPSIYLRGCRTDSICSTEVR